MTKEIKIKDGVLKKLNIDKSKQIFMIGYTLNKNNTGYDRAIIVRDENESLITDNQEVIMQFFNILAEQRSIPLGNIFQNPDIVALNQEQANKLDELFDMRDDLDQLSYDKKMAILKTSLASFLCAISYVATNMPIDKSLRLISSAIIILSSISAVKSYKDAKTINVSEIESELQELIEKFADELCEGNEKSLIK